MYKEEADDTETTHTVQVLEMSEAEAGEEKGYDPYNTATDIKAFNRE